MILKETIRRVLREESKKYLKPSDNVNQLIIKQLNNLFSGSQMYHEDIANTRQDFLFCKDGKEIAEVWLYFEDEDDDLYESIDDRPTNERPFSEGTLKIYKETIDGLLRFIPVRKNYLLYAIENWFEETYLLEIEKKMGRNDLEIDEIFESGNDMGVCVPPMTKPEDVTMEDMIDYIKNNTLYRHNEIERREKEEPGWIEKTYLQKLRRNEIDRLNN